ncbi:MAG: tRNA (5-methylaminomethyl-2-thiouridine)(34)-methyltransferase MnmD [Cyclobacteriaceae bacterium]|nr:tRNA (5-methylaminomethyl-2-thiouridine)(34)-methyltransferase MnmD [Cyclobacteriaceae bacterium]
MSEIRVIETDDGSHSLYVPSLKETYHSTHGAIQESQHVFIRKGIHFYLESHHNSEIKILEIGFGTGLNALLTFNELSGSNITTSYDTIEPFPINEAVWSKLNYVEKIETDNTKDIYGQMHSASWETKIELEEGYFFTKLKEKLEDIELQNNYYDLIFFDAFAPNKQPELWQLPQLKKIVNSMKEGGVFVTYCAQGQFKRDLKEAGLTLESLPGPPGKKEMVRGVK